MRMALSTQSNARVKSSNNCTPPSMVDLGGDRICCWTDRLWLPTSVLICRQWLLTLAIASAADLICRNPKWGTDKVCGKDDISIDKSVVPSPVSPKVP